MSSSDIFGKLFDCNFRKNTKSIGYGEISLFRELSATLQSMNSQFKVEEYHGSSKQVRFNGNGSYARKKSRCELSDLLLVTIDGSNKNVRMTYLQAKSERTSVIDPCCKKFSANLEQWYLLKKRPNIRGATKTFTPPSNLLSSAILPSIGSFGFFYKKSGSQIFYVAADHLKLPGLYSSKNGKLQSIGNCKEIIRNGHVETVSACGNYRFAKALYEQKIGSPIVTDGNVIIENQVSLWLKSCFNYFIEQSEDNELLSTLINLLDVQGATLNNQQIGAKKIILINTLSNETK